MIFQEPMASLNPSTRWARQVVTEALRQHETLDAHAARLKGHAICSPCSASPIRANALGAIRISSRAACASVVMIAIAHLG
jgi:ABC-type dipeptide/oligopeptide/nickel transport system ATPase component